MSEYVLFSPVGGHDPIANYRDGALLHICRCYQPKAVYLYLSQEMCLRNQQDNRYVDALHRLEQLLAYHIEKIEVVEKPDLVDVQLFDSFYEDFENILDKIKQDYPNTEILVNTSSGTPAMKGALNLIASLSKHKITALQVTTPYKKENPKLEPPEEYDLEAAWECNEDNERNFEKRCSEFQQVNLLAKIKKEMIVRLIEAYDYQAALDIAESIDEFIPKEVLTLLMAAKCRLMLDHKGVRRALQGTIYNIFPVNSGKHLIIFEYLLYLQLRQKQGNYADFVRGVTPVVMDLLEALLWSKCKIDLKDYCIEKVKYNNKTYIVPENDNIPKYMEDIVRKGDHIFCLYNVKLAASSKGLEIQNILQKKFRGEIQENPYTSAQIYPLLENYIDDTKLIALLSDLKKIERDVRNITAHQIVSVTEDWINRKVEMSSKDIMDLLKRLAANAGLSIKQEFWNSYDDMNKLIVDILCL